MWCGCFDGTVIKFNCQNYQQLVRFSLPLANSKALLLALAVVNQTLWYVMLSMQWPSKHMVSLSCFSYCRCGLSTCIAIVQPSNGQPVMRLKSATAVVVDDHSTAGTPVPALPALWPDQGLTEPVIIATTASQYLVRGAHGEVRHNSCEVVQISSWITGRHL